MYSFRNDYSEGAHHKILEALNKSNLSQQEGYGDDEYCLEAARVIKSKLNSNNVDIHFLSGGTQTNLISISAFLNSYEAVIAPESGHICVHETGAIENTGHKIIKIKTSNGKLTPELIKPLLNEYINEHSVVPKLIFISNATEIGTIYNKKELQKLSSFCKENDLYLYLDGARLGVALDIATDLKLADLVNLTDAFYIGGTKNGALIGEALVLCNNTIKLKFRYHLKQRGALLAKGRLLGLQFQELFKDDLYFKLAKNANVMASKLRESIKSAGYNFLTDSLTNQIFPIFPNWIISKLLKRFSFYEWEKINESETAVRLVTSWATNPDAIIEFNKYLLEIKLKGK